MSQSDELFTPEETAKKLHIKPQTLAVWRSHRRYSLAYVKVGGKVLYSQRAIDRFIQSRTVTNE
jgi:Helix-turn-helix domain